jgi:hypothetical protein
MVFSVNAVETSPNNFAAFQAAAKQQNGSVTASSSSPYSTGTGTGTGSKPNGADMIQINHSAGIMVVLVGVVFGVLM